MATERNLRQAEIVKVNSALAHSEAGRELLENAKQFFHSWLCDVARRFPVKIGDQPVFDRIATTLVDCGFEISEKFSFNSSKDWSQAHADFSALLTERLLSGWLEDFVVSGSSLKQDSSCIHSVKEWIDEDEWVLDDLFLSYNEIDDGLEGLLSNDEPDSSPNIVQLASHKDSLRVKKNVFKRQFVDYLNADLGRIDSAIDEMRSTDVYGDIKNFIHLDHFKTLMAYVRGEHQMAGPSLNPRH